MRTEFEFLIPIVFFASIAAVLYHFIKFRNAERMAVIEKGLSEEQLNFFKGAKKQTLFANQWTIKLSVLLIGVGLAVMIGEFVPNDMRETMTIGLMFLLPGLGLLLSYKYIEKKVTEEN